MHVVYMNMCERGVMGPNKHDDNNTDNNDKKTGNLDSLNKDKNSNENNNIPNTNRTNTLYVYIFLYTRSLIHSLSHLSYQ